MIILRIPTHVSKHELGEYMSRNNTDFGYIPIPKNASTSLRSYFGEILDFQYVYNYNNYTRKKYIVCLRNPLDRWFAGVTEYFFRNFCESEFNFEKRSIDINNKDILKFIFDRKIFDSHTEPQINFLNRLNTDDIYFFKVDNNLTENICKFTTEMFNIHYERCVYFGNKELNRNITSSKIKKQSILDSLKNYAELNPHFIKEIKDCYKNDYELFNGVKYYGSN